MRSGIRLYQIIAILSFLILAAVQFFLVYNTYRLKDEQHYFEEKEAINSLYRSSISNDKIFPGGQQIIDKYVNAHMRELDSLLKSDKKVFEALGQRICDSIFRELREKSTVDSLMKGYLKKIQFEGSLEWLSVLQEVSVTFDGINYVQLCPINIEGKDGLNFNGIISGGLDNPNKTNEVSAITVSSPTPYSSRITFRLYADSPYRVLLILRKMWPVLLLALFSIFCVAAIFYLTFRNWLKQKKLAEMKSDFVNSITHEFNTPLSSIIVANKSLQNERIMEDRERVLSLTAVINRQSQRLKTLFNQVLDLTLMDASNLQLEELVLEDLLEEIIQDYRLLVQNQLVTISYEKPSTRHKVMLDRFWTTTMIINLLDNGIKYNNHTHKELKVFTRLNGKKLALHIADNGVGIPEDMKGLIFDKFFRSTNNMANNATNGLGLGLFYVRQCVHAHGWELDLRSKEKEGTEFIIYVSLA